MYWVHGDGKWSTEVYYKWDEKKNLLRICKEGFSENCNNFFIIPTFTQYIE